MIITLDGPVASGKSTLSLALANRLNFYYLYTGLLYRFLAYYLVVEQKRNEKHLATIAEHDIQKILTSPHLVYSYDPVHGAHVSFAGKDYTPFLKTSQVDKWASIISTRADVRARMVDFQRAAAKKHSVVVDGRDCGSVVFPYADKKFYITASLDVRAQRWQKNQLKLHNIYTLEESKSIIEERDKRDMTRTLSPLIKTADAIEIDTTKQTISQSLDQILNYIHTPQDTQ
jgi:CMP/dCMP kinase